MELLIQRNDLKPTCTFGDFFINDEYECLSFEDVVREIPGVDVKQWKVDKETAIPYGRYPVIWDYSPHFNRWMLHILNVSGFAGIRIHSGNKPADTDGCIIVGDGRTGDMITGGKAHNVLVRLEKKVCAALNLGEEVWLTIRKFEENPNDTEGS